MGDKDYDLGTRFAITGSAQIAPGWSAGYNITVNTWATIFGFGANQEDDLAGTYGDINTLYRICTSRATRSARSTGVI